MANTTGKKWGGRTKGTPNKHTASIQSLIEGLVEKGKSYVEQVLDGSVPCGVCHGEGKTRFQPARGLKSLGIRTCQSCYGSGLERLSPETRLRAALDAINYGHAKKQATEITNPDGSLKPTWVVKMPDTNK